MRLLRLGLLFVAGCAAASSPGSVPATRTSVVEIGGGRGSSPEVISVQAGVVRLMHSIPSGARLRATTLEGLDEANRHLSELRRVTKPGGWIVVTTLFAFPEHGFPDDYFRYTRNGLAQVLSEAGWTDIETAYMGEFRLRLDDHGEGPINKRDIPMHGMAVARA